MHKKYLIWHCSCRLLQLLRSIIAIQINLSKSGLSGLLILIMTVQINLRYLINVIFNFC